MKEINNNAVDFKPVPQQQAYYFSGRYYGMELNSTVINSNVSQAADTMIGTIFTTNIPLTIDRIGIQNNATAAANGKIFIYRDDFQSTGNYLPSELVYEDTAISFASDTTFKENTVDITLYPGIVYWIGLIVDASVTIRRLVLGQCISMGSTAGNTNPNNSISYSHTYATALPTTLTQSGLSVSSQNPPNVRFRIA